jgi:hypothetical protein
VLFSEGFAREVAVESFSSAGLDRKHHWQLRAVLKIDSKLEVLEPKHGSS